MPLNQLARQRVKPAMKNKYRRLLLRSRYRESKAKQVIGISLRINVLCPQFPGYKTNSNVAVCPTFRLNKISAILPIRNAVIAFIRHIKGRQNGNYTPKQINGEFNKVDNTYIPNEWLSNNCRGARIWLIVVKANLCVFNIAFCVVVWCISENTHHCNQKNKVNDTDNFYISEKTLY